MSCRCGVEHDDIVVHRLHLLHELGEAHTLVDARDSRSEVLEHGGKRGGFGVEYNPLYGIGRFSGGTELGPGRLTGEATVSRDGKSSVGARYTMNFNKGGKVYNKRGQPRKVNY